MNGDFYWVVSNSGGDTHVTVYSRQELLAKLAEDYWGSRQVMTAMDWVQVSGDTNYWGKKILIIKGTLAKVTPPGDWGVE